MQLVQYLSKHSFAPSRTNLLFALGGIFLGIVVGLALSFYSRPTGRFVNAGGAWALDTKTGLYCNPLLGHPNTLPYCWDIYTGKMY